MVKKDVIKKIKEALAEDIGKQDITTDTLIPLQRRCLAKVIVKEPAIICGLPILKWVYQTLNKRCRIRFLAKEGQKVKKGQTVAQITGPARDILSGERVALNFLQKLSGIATTTHLFVKSVKNSKVKILDTRKTTPGLRALEKYAVKLGGGQNHRMGLYDAAIIKDNHLQLVRLPQLFEKVKKLKKRGFVEIEAKNLSQVKKFTKLDVDAIMLDNFRLKDIKKAVKIVKKNAPQKIVEVSGGVSLKNVRKISGCGVDWISVGALTHSSKAIDISIEIKNARSIK
jgi:nicotinate-nucleotide pyrophosphorylase (carboxylating)